MLPCELCQDRKVAAISRDVYVSGISWTSFNFIYAMLKRAAEISESGHEHPCI
jgi:hypothetical protein